MYRVFLRYLLIGTLAYFLSGFLKTLIPIPTEDMVDGFLNLENEKDYAFLMFLRFIVWIIVIDLILRFFRPFMGFMMPTARRFAATKPMRRVHAVIAELALLAISYLLVISVILIFSWSGMYHRKIFEVVDAKQQENFNSFNNARNDSIAATWTAIKNIVELGNAYLSSEIEKNKNSQNVIVLEDEWFFYTMEGLKEYPNRHSQWKKYSKDKYKEEALYIKNTNHRNYVTRYLNSIGARPEYWTGNTYTYSDWQIKTINQDKYLQWLASNHPEHFKHLNPLYLSHNYQYQNYRSRLTILASKLDSIKNELPTYYYYSEDDKQFFGDISTEVKDEIRKQVKSAIWSDPFGFVQPIFQRLNYLIFIFVASLYGLSHVPEVRRKGALLYENILRFWDQTKYGLGGSARFATIVEEWATPFRKGKHSIFLGKSLTNPFAKIGSEDSRHMLTIAGTRAGKGTSAIIPNLLLWEGSAVVIDPKGTNAIVTARRRREMGQDVLVLDPFNFAFKEKSDCFNPLAALDPNSDDIRERVGVIADALVIRDPNPKETHWDDGAKTVIAGLIGHLISSKKYENPNLSMVRDLLCLDPKDQVDLWFEMYQNEGAGNLPKETASRLMKGHETNEVVGILSNANKHTEWLSSKPMKRMLSESTFSLAEIKNKPTTVYLILPPDLLDEHSRFLRLMINLVLKQMSIGGKSKIPTLMIMDEFAVLEKMNQVSKAMGLLAGYNIVLWPILQDYGQLKRIYGSSANTFVNNSRAVQVFGVTDEDTTGFVSNMIGKNLAEKRSIRSNMRSPVSLRDEREVASDINIKTNRQYILRSGQPPLLIEKVPYHKSKMFKGMYDDDPDYPSSNQSDHTGVFGWFRRFV